jgi:hypothetical protein
MKRQADRLSGLPPAESHQKEPFVMSFPRHGQIYQSDVLFVPEAKLASTPPPAFHRLDEFAASYSLAGCSPALPASALPASPILHLSAETVNHRLRTFLSDGFDFALAETIAPG